LIHKLLTCRSRFCNIARFSLVGCTLHLSRKRQNFVYQEKYANPCSDHAGYVGAGAAA
jgi:hypothetical protein